MPTLDWIGKNKVINHHQDVPVKTLKKIYTFNANDSKNMIIHGDNLYALKALLPQYEGNIDCIYIDPPYNTAHSTNINQRWVYNDNVDDPKIQKWLGEVVGDENEDFSRHDKWLCMMYPRLQLLRQLLAKDGVIFVSIDNNEITNLRFIMDEIFGKSNFVTMFAVENNPKGRKNNDFVSESYEYCVLYCKDKDFLSNKYPKRVFNNLKKDKKISKSVLSDDWGEFTQSKRQVSGPNESNDLCKNSNDSRCFTIYYNKENGDVVFLDEYDRENNVWFQSEDGKILLENNYIRYICTNKKTKEPAIPLYTKETILQKHEEHGIFFKDDGTIYEKERNSEQQVTSFLPNKRFGFDLMTESATTMLEEIFGEEGKFNNSKNVGFIKLLLSLIRKENAIILDSFAGSGTTGHAVLDLNSTDKQDRQFILVEMGDYANDVTAERIKRVIKGYGNGEEYVNGVGGNFSFYELGEPFFDENQNINRNIDVEKVKQYVYYIETKDTIDKNLTHDNQFLLGIKNNTSYYLFYDKKSIFTLNMDLLSKINTKTSSYVIYADKCVLSDEFLLNHQIVFKKIPRDIARF